MGRARSATRVVRRAGAADWLELTLLGIFDESEVEAGHRRLAFSISPQIAILKASIELIRSAILREDKIRNDPEEHADYLAVSQLGFRIVNDVGAATKLLDCGYFIQAAGLLRDLSEIGMLALFFADAPGEVRQWRKLQGRQQSSKYGPTALRKKLQLQNSEKLAFLDERFQLFSDYGAHPSSTSIIAHHDGKRFHTGPHVNETLYINTYKDLAHLVWCVTDACGDAYASIFGMYVADVCPDEARQFLLTREILNSALRTQEGETQVIDAHPEGTAAALAKGGVVAGV